MKNKKTFLITMITLILLLVTTSQVMASTISSPTVVSAVADAGFWALIVLILASMPSVLDVLKTVLDWLLSIFTFLAVISFIITGIMFIFSGSNPELKERAKSGVTYSIIGIVAGLSGYIILNTISNLLTNSI